MEVQKKSDFENMFFALNERDINALKNLLNLHPQEFITKVLLDDNVFVFALILDENRSDFCEQISRGEFTLLRKTIDFAALGCEQMCRAFIKKNRCF